MVLEYIQVLSVFHTHNTTVRLYLAVIVHSSGARKIEWLQTILFTFEYKPVIAVCYLQSQTPLYCEFS